MEAQVTFNHGVMVNTAAQTDAPAVVPLTDPTGAPHVIPSPEIVHNGFGLGDSLTPDQVQKLAQWAVEDKKMTIDQANEYLKGEGLNPLVQQETNQFAKALETQLPAAKPEEFQFPRVEPSPGRSEKDIEAFQTNARQWFSAGGLTREAGNFIAEEARKAEVAISQMNPDQMRAWAQEQESIVRKVFGNKADEKFQAVNAFVKQIDSKHPGLADYFRNSGVGHSANVIVRLIQHLDAINFKGTLRGK